MPVDVVAHLTQFGVAGLIAAMWLLERRHASMRHRQLSEAHRRMMEAERDAQMLMDVVKENTRAIAALESTQRQLIDLFRSVNQAKTQSCHK